MDVLAIAVGVLIFGSFLVALWLYEKKDRDRYRESERFRLATRTCRACTNEFEHSFSVGPNYVMYGDMSFTKEFKTSTDPAQLRANILQAAFAVMRDHDACKVTRDALQAATKDASAIVAELKDLGALKESG